MLHRLYPAQSRDVAVGSAYRVEEGQFLRANMVASLDGAAYLAGRTAGLSGAADRELCAALRAMADAILVGAGTVTLERYRPAGVPIAVVSGRLSLDLAGPLFASPPARPLLLTCAAAPAARLAAAREVADVIVAGSDTVDLAGALAALRERGLNQLLCEGGPILLAHLFRADLVDELCLTLSPRLLGGDARRILDGSLDTSLAGTRPMRLRELYEAEGFLFTRYAAVRA